MTDLQKKIEELKSIANGNTSDATKVWLAKKAFSIIDQLQEEKEKFRQIGLDWIEIANKQKEEIKQLKEKEKHAE